MMKMYVCGSNLSIYLSIYLKLILFMFVYIALCKYGQSTPQSNGNEGVVNNLQRSRTKASFRDVV